MQRELLTKQQLSAKLKISARTINRYMTKGMPYITIGEKLIRFDYNEVYDWIKKDNFKLYKYGISSDKFDISKLYNNDLESINVDSKKDSFGYYGYCYYKYPLTKKIMLDNYLVFIEIIKDISTKIKND